MDTSFRETKEAWSCSMLCSPEISKHQIQDNPSSDSGSSSDLDLDDVIPSRVADVQYKVVDGKPGLSVSTRKTYTWTPLAARTRAI